jgi:hypothetical protein
MRQWICLRASLKIPRDAVFEQRAGWRDATRENTLHGFSTKEQRSQTAVGSQTLRAAGLLAVGCVGSVVTARYGDAPPSPPCPPPKSLAAAHLAIFRQALSHGDPSSTSVIARWQVYSWFNGFIIHYMNIRVAALVHLVNFFFTL